MTRAELLEAALKDGRGLGEALTQAAVAELWLDGRLESESFAPPAQRRLPAPRETPPDGAPSGQTAESPEQDEPGPAVARPDPKPTRRQAAAAKRDLVLGALRAAGHPLTMPEAAERLPSLTLSAVTYCMNKLAADGQVLADRNSTPFRFRLPPSCAAEMPEAPEPGRPLRPWEKTPVMPPAVTPAGEMRDVTDSILDPGPGKRRAGGA